MAENDELYHCHLDHLGTPKALTSEAGDLVWQAQYQTYGNLALKQVEEVSFPIRFQGQYYDEETVLHYNRHRYYDPGVGQFTTQDPIGLLGGVNNYQYAPNPIGWVDPVGLTCKEGYTSSIPDDYDLMEDMQVNEIVEKNNFGGFVGKSDEIFNACPELQGFVYQHEFLALRAYTGPNYTDMNGVLRGSKPHLAEEWAPVNASAKRALKKLVASEDYLYVGEVYRGTNMDAEKVHERFPDVGGIYQDAAFTSTSTDKGVAYDGFFQGNVRITAQAKSGVKVDSFSATGGESEVLFKPGTKFKVTKKELMSDGKTWDIRLEEV